MIHFGCSHWGAFSAQKVPECPSINRNAFYSLNFVLPLFLGNPKKALVCPEKLLRGGREEHKQLETFSTPCRHPCALAGAEGLSPGVPEPCSSWGQGGSSHILGFWVEQHSQVIIWDFFSQKETASARSGRWHLFLDCNLPFYIFQLNNYAGFYYYNSLGLLAASFPPVSNSQPCAKEVCKCEHFQESQQEIQRKDKTPVGLLHRGRISAADSCTEFIPCCSGSVIPHQSPGISALLRLTQTFQGSCTKANTSVFTKCFCQQG